MNLNKEFFIIKKDEKIEKNIEKNSVLFFIDYEKNNTSINVKLSLNSTLNIKIYYLNINEDFNKNFNIEINHENSSQKCFFVAKCFSSGKATTNLIVCNNIEGKKSNCEIDQKIDGVLFSNCSTIKVLPTFNLEKNKNNAKHSVNIGKIDDNLVFYLNSKKIDVEKSKEIILNSYLQIFLENDVIPNDIKNKILSNFQSIINTTKKV